MMQVDLMKPEKLTAAHIAVWERILDENAALASPCFRPEFTQIVSRCMDNDMSNARHFLTDTSMRAPLKNVLKVTRDWATTSFRTQVTQNCQWTPMQNSQPAGVTGDPWEWNQTNAHNGEVQHAVSN